MAMAASKTAERSHDGTHKDLAQFVFATTMLVHAPADITRAGSLTPVVDESVRGILTAAL